MQDVCELMQMYVSLHGCMWAYADVYDRVRKNAEFENKKRSGVSVHSDGVLLGDFSVVDPIFGGYFFSSFSFLFSGFFLVPIELYARESFVERSHLANFFSCFQRGKEFTALFPMSIQSV